MQKRSNTFNEVCIRRDKMDAMKLKIKYLSSFAVCFLLLASSCSQTHEKPPWEYMPNMVDTPAVKAYRETPRLPAEGTLPRDYDPYPYSKDQGDLAGAELKNPLVMSKANLLHGQQLFNIYCIVCHGERGKGDGYIVPKFPRPPSLLSEKVRDWPDGRIYHVITRGQNLMPSYATQIRPSDRWAIVDYVRVLQRAAKPNPEDVEALKKALKEGTLP